MDHRGVAILTISLIILTSFSNLDDTSAERSSESASERNGYPVGRDPVMEIHGDDELEEVASRMGWEGTGTAGDPIIADNLTIDGGGDIHCFEIINTNLSLVIQDSIFFNATSNSAPYNFGYGITIDDCINITLYNCTFLDNRRGLSMKRSKNITAKNCSFQDNVQYGVMIHASDMTDLIGCDLSGSKTNIYNYYSSRNRILESVSVQSDQHLDIWYSDIVTLKDCSLASSGYARFLNTHDVNITDNGINGVRVQCGNNGVCNVIDNKFLNSVLLLGSVEQSNIWGNNFTGGGIQLSSSIVSLDDIDISSNNTVNALPVFYSRNEDHQNKSVSGSWGQYIFGNVTGVILENKTMKNVGYPVTLIKSRYVRLENLNVSRAERGIYGHYCKYLKVVNNSLSDIDIVAMDLRISTDLLIVSNTVSGSTSGLMATQRIVNITILDNIVTNCTDGIILSYWVKDSLIKGNHVEKCVNGIKAMDMKEQGNSIEDNTIIDSGDRGLYLYYTIGYRILNNRIIGSGISGIELKQSFYDVFVNNMITGCDFHSILINDSGRCEFYDNEMHGSGFMLYRRNDVSVNTIPSNNTVNSMPVYYYKGNGEGWTVPDTSGQIVIDGCSNLNVEGIEFNNVSFPVVVTQADLLSIRNCQFNDFGKGAIHIFQPSSTLIESNEFSRGERGIEIYNPYLWRSRTVSVNGNNFTSISDRALRVYALKGFQGADNRIMDSGNGFVIRESNNCTLNGNLFNDCSGIVIDLQRVHFTRLNDNSINSCYAGVKETLRSNNNVYIFNLFKDCIGPAVILDDECYKDRIYNNAFINNNGTGDTLIPGRPQVTDEYGQGRWYHPDGTGNYWHDHRTPDNDDDGVIDIPYLISDQVSDDHPLKDIPFTLVSIPTYAYAMGGRGYIMVGWKEPEETRGFPVLKYRILRYNETQEQKLIFEVEGGRYEYNDTSVEDDERYTYQLLAITELGVGELTGPLTAVSDGTPPTVKILSPLNGSVINTTSIDMGWETEDPHSGSGISSIMLVLDGNRTYDVTNLDSIKITNLTEGPHGMDIHVKDNVGFLSTASCQFIVDLDLPDVDILQPVNGSMINHEYVEVTWTGSDPTSAIQNYSLRIDGMEWIFLESNTSRNISGLCEGYHTVEIMVRDSGGNFNITTVEFLVDVTPPILSISGIRNGSYHRIGRVLINWSAEDTISGLENVSLYIDGLMDTEDLIIEEFYIDGLSDGLHEIKVIATDRAGNSISITTLIFVDTVFPRITDYFPSGAYISPDSIIYAHLSEEMDWDSVTLEFLGIPVNYAREGLNISYRPTLGMDPGMEYNIRITGQDRAGNPISFQWNFTTLSMGSVMGQVLTEDEFPIEGASINVNGKELARSDENGFYHFNISSGKYELVISSEGYSTRTVFIDVSAGVVNDAGQIMLTSTTEDVRDEEDGESDILLLILIGLAVMSCLVLLMVIIIARRTGGTDREVPPVFRKAEQLRYEARKQGFDISDLEGDYRNALYQHDIGDSEDSIPSMESYMISLQNLMEGPDE